MNPTNRIQYYRKKMNLSQEELGEKLYVSRQTVSQWETGQTVPSVDNLIRLHDIFNTSIDEILGVTETNKAETEETPLEQYRFRLTKEEIQQVHKYQKRPSVRGIIVCSFFTLISFIAAFSSLHVLYGILFGVLLTLLIRNTVWLKGFNKNAQKVFLAIDQKEYVCAVYNDRLKIEIYADQNPIVSETRQFSDIEGVADTGTHYLVTIAGKTYILKKDMLAENSKLLLKLKLQGGPKIGLSLEQKKWIAVSKAAIALSILSIFIALFISVIISNKLDFSNTSSMWILYLFLPIPAFSIVLGKILQKKGLRHKVNVTVGIVICILLCVYGSFTFLFPNSDYAVIVIEKNLQIDLPQYNDYRAIKDFYPNDREHIKSAAKSEIYFTEENSAVFYASLDDRWLDILPGELKPALAADQSELRADFGLLYNMETGEYNTLPAKGGKQIMILLFFSRKNNVLYFYQYELIT